MILFILPQSRAAVATRVRETGMLSQFFIGMIGGVSSGLVYQFGRDARVLQRINEVAADVQNLRRGVNAWKDRITELTVRNNWDAGIYDRGLDFVMVRT